jgi:hypothetical protein
MIFPVGYRLNRADPNVLPVLSAGTSVANNIDNMLEIWQYECSPRDRVST